MKTTVDIESNKSDAADLSRLVADEKKKRTRRMLYSLPIVLGASFLTLAVLDHFLFRDINDIPVVTYWWRGITAGYFLIWIPFLLRLSLNPSVSERNAAVKLAKSCDVYAIPGLVDSLELQHRVHEVRAGLIDLLSTLRREHAQIFSRKQLAFLTAIPMSAAGAPFKRRFGNHEDLVFPCLQALGEIGDRRCLRSLESILVFGSRSEKGLAIRAEVEKTCKKLRETIEEEEKSGTLVRPAESVSEESSLLKPATGAAEVAGESLVRPTVGETSPEPQRAALLQGEQPATQEQLNKT